MGRHGLRQVAELCYHKAHYAAARIAELPGYELVSTWPFFNEFVVRPPISPTEVNARLSRDHNIVGGYDLGLDYPTLQGTMLLCATEMNSRAEIDELVSALRASGS